MDLDQKYCRVCMKTSSITKNLKFGKYTEPIPETTNQQKRSLRQIFLECTSIDVSLDRFSQEICQSCCDRLIQAYQFRREAIQTDDHLHNRLLIKEEFDENVGVKVELVTVDSVKGHNDDELDLKRESDSQEESSDEAETERPRTKQKSSRKQKEYICSGCHEIFPKRKALVVHRKKNKGKFFTTIYV